MDNGVEVCPGYPVRRMLRLSLLSLLLGLLTTWLVAWAFGVWGRVDYLAGGPDWDFEEGSTMAHIRHKRVLGVDYLRVLFQVEAAESQSSGSRFKNFANLDMLPHWSRAFRCWSSGQAAPAEGWPNPGDDNQWVGGIWHEAAFGWPFPALRSMTDGQAVVDGLTPPGWLPAIRDPHPHAVLPYRPVWSGLLVDTLSFTGLCALGGFLFGVTRRRWRVSRSRCPWCNYDMRGCPGIACPECGRERVAEPSS